MYKIKNYNRTELLEENIFTLIWRYSLPATTGMLVNASFNIIDTIFVGFLGSEAIAALSVSFPVQMLMGGIAIGTAVGASSLISRQLGAAEYEEANKTASQAFSLALLLSLIIVFIGTFYLKDMIAIFGATPEIFSATCEYLSVILWGAPTVFLMMMSNNIIRGEGNPVMSMKIMIAGAVLNIILDPIFIFAFSLGIRGAALATVIARTLVLFYVAYYYLSGKSLIRISARWFILRWKIVYEIYRVGISAIFMQIAINLATIFVNRILGDYDYLGIAALGIIIRLQALIILPCIGISQGLLTIIGFNYGAGLKKRVRESFLKAVIIAFGFAFCISLPFFLFPDFFIGIFSRDPQLVDIASRALRIIVITVPIASFQIISSVLFQGTGRGFPALVLTLSRQLILYLPLVFLLNRF
ncbi:MAG: MATE family efflux transporter, partial [Dethiobacteria bacterium]